MTPKHRPSHRSSWAAGFVLSVTLAVFAVLAAPSEAAARSAARPAAKAAVVKARPSTQVRRRAGAAASAAKKGPIDIRMSSPPAAALAALQEATITTGCSHAGPAGHPQLQLGLSAREFDKLANAAWPDGADAPAAFDCAAFASIELPDAATIAYAPQDAGADLRRALFVTQLGADAASQARWHELGAEADDSTEVWLTVAAVESMGDEAQQQIPPEQRAELAALVRQMKRLTGASGASLVRMIFQPGDEAAELTAVELVDEATGRVHDSAIWIARADEPGAFISTRGFEYERALWQSPVDHQRISRGIGASSMVVHKRVVVQLKSRARGQARAKTRSRVVVQAYRYLGQHVGIDFAAPIGTPVVSVAEGEVVFSGWRGGYGNLLIVRHGSELSTYYGHLSAFAPDLQPGMKVRRGQMIGLVGSTGFSTGPHLHFEIRKDGRYVDPTRADQKLPVWTLQPQEHEAALARLLQLEITRPPAFERHARVALVAHAPIAAPAK